MKTFFLIIYFKLYAFAKFCSKDNLYQYTAMYLSAFLITFNLFTLVAYYRCLVHPPKIHLNSMYPPKLVLIIVAFSIVGIIYYVLVRDERYKIYREEFLKNEKISGKFGTFITILYIIITFVFSTSVLWLKCGI